MERMYDLSFKQDADGTVRLTQTDCGDDYVVLAHPEQLKFIVRCLCGTDEATASKVADRERKLSVIADRLEKLIDAKWFRSEILDHCGEGVEMLTRLDSILDLAIEMDGRRAIVAVRYGDRDGGN